VLTTGSFKLMSRVNYRRDRPWRDEKTLSDVPYDVTAQRVTGSAVASYAFTSDISANAGAEYYYEDAKAHGAGATVAARNGYLSRSNVALFAEATAQTAIATSMPAFVSTTTRNFPVL